MATASLTGSITPEQARFWLDYMLPSDSIGGTVPWRDVAIPSLVQHYEKIAAGAAPEFFGLPGGITETQYRDLYAPQRGYLADFTQPLNAEDQANFAKFVADINKRQGRVNTEGALLLGGIGGGALAFGGAGGAAAGSASAGGTAAGAAELSTPEWLSGLLAETGEAGIGAGALEGGFNAAATGLGTSAATGGGMDWLTELLGETGELGIDPSVLEGGFNPAISNAPWWSSLPTGVQDLVQGVSGLGGNILDLFSGNASGGASRPGGGFLDTALATAPILAAINYARNQGPFDTSRLTSTYDQFDPNALAYEYDQNTARGRNQLTSSLAQRGVMGSSFGTADLTNYQTTRDLGRRSLINQGLAQRGNIAASIIDAQAKDRQLKNQLYGQSLLALGNIFGGRNQPSINLGVT